MCCGHTDLHRVNKCGNQEVFWLSFPCIKIENECLNTGQAGLAGDIGYLIAVKTEMQYIVYIEDFIDYYSKSLVT